MGNFFTRMIYKFTQKEMNSIMVGLDNAGKTTILYKLKLGEIVNTIPTIGFNVEDVKYKNINLTIWDVGGQDKLRPLWKYYFKNASIVIFVIDSSDRNRIYESEKELDYLLTVNELRDSKFLILCNKIDMDNHMDKELIAENLNLKHKLRRHKWYIINTCATDGYGLDEGMQWIMQNSEPK